MQNHDVMITFDAIRGLPSAAAAAAVAAIWAAAERDATLMAEMKAVVSDLLRWEEEQAKQYSPPMGHSIIRYNNERSNQHFEQQSDQQLAMMDIAW